MRDILGRVIKENDLVVAKGTGRYNRGLRVGVYKEPSIYFGVSYGTYKRGMYSQLFLIENPSPTEEEIRKKILGEIELQKQRTEEAKKERQAKKVIPKKELKIGTVYLDDRGDKYVYLGKCEDENKVGYGYIRKYDRETFELKIDNYDIRKTPRRLVEVVEEDCMELHKKMIIKDKQYHFWSNTYDIIEKELILHDLKK